MWLQVVIQSNLLFTVNYSSHFTANPRKTYWNTMKYTITYVKETINYGITYYHGESLQLVDFVNSNYVNGKDTQRLTNRYIFFVGEGPMS